MVRPITMNSEKDVEKVMKFAQKYGHSVQVSSGTTTVNAMSMLGLLSLVGKPNVNLIFSDHDGSNRVSKINRCLRKVGIK